MGTIPRQEERWLAHWYINTYEYHIYLVPFVVPEKKGAPIDQPTVGVSMIIYGPTLFNGQFPVMPYQVEAHTPSKLGF